MKPLNDQMPTFFVIGASKCGTTSLHRYLDLHPDISMSSFKEPAFFIRERLYRMQVTDRYQYLRLFEPGFRQRGESSVSYSWWPIRKGAPEAISEEVPGAKFVYLVRDPIERARSHYIQLESSRNPYSLRYFRGRALDRAWTDLDPSWNVLVAAGLYMSQIRQYLEFFPKKSILVIDSDDLRDERLATLNRICRFLDVEPMPEFGAAVEEELNLAGDKRQEAEWYVRLAESPNLRRVIDPLPREFREGLTGAIRRVVSRPLEKPVLSDETREALERSFRPEVEEMREFTGQSFSSWSI